MSKTIDLDIPETAIERIAQEDAAKECECPNCGRLHKSLQAGRPPFVTVTSAQHIALMAAAETMRVLALGTHGKGPPFGIWSEEMAKHIAEQCLASLRAAGIRTEGK
jgi:hypothetical protein